MNNQIIAALRKNAAVPFIAVGGALVAIPVFLFLLSRLVYVRGIQELLTPAAVRKLAAWRKGQAASASLSSSLRNGWLPASIKQVTAVLDRLNRRKGL